MNATACAWCELQDCPMHPPLPGIGARGTKQADALRAQAMVDNLFTKENRQ